MINEKELDNLNYNLSYVTNYNLNKIFKNIKEEKPKLIFNNKPIVTKFINKIIFPDKSFYKNDDEYLEKINIMKNLKINILNFIEKNETKDLVLREILYYKNQESLFKFIDNKTKKITLIYKTNVNYNYFLEDVLEEKKNYDSVKIIIEEIINKIILNELYIIKIENNEYILNLESKFKEKLKDINIEENVNFFDIEENDITKNLFFEIYNLKKKNILYNFLIIDLCIKNEIINVENLILIINSIYKYLNKLLKLKKNFIISQEINLLSYCFIIIKCIIHNSKKNFKKEDKKKLNILYNLYNKNFLKILYNYPNNYYLKFL